MLVFNTFSPIVLGAEGIESEAVLKISEAEDFLDNAYLSLLEIEKAGGDVSELVVILNNALEHYAEALRVFESGEYVLAVEFADKAIHASNVILETDFSLIFFIGIVTRKSFRNKLFLSLGASGIIIIFTFLGWRIFKNYYIGSKLT